MEQTVWIVYDKLKLEDIEVFSNKEAAINHRKNMTNKWKVTAIVERELRSF